MASASGFGIRLVILHRSIGGFGPPTPKGVAIDALLAPDESDKTLHWLVNCLDGAVRVKKSHPSATLSNFLRFAAFSSSAALAANDDVGSTSALRI
jgi:hypothetical protein